MAWRSCCPFEQIGGHAVLCAVEHSGVTVVSRSGAGALWKQEGAGGGARRSPLRTHVLASVKRVVFERSL